MTPDNTANTTTTTAFLSFKGLGILCFYGQDTGGIVFQGHCIDKTTHSSPFSLAGKLLPDYVDPKHNDCMEPDDFYQVLLHSHSVTSSSISTKKKLIVRRSKNNDAAGLSTHENEAEKNKNFCLEFDTHQWFSGSKAGALKTKYFPKSPFDSEDLTVCMGDIEFYQEATKQEGG